MYIGIAYVINWLVVPTFQYAPVSALTVMHYSEVRGFKSFTLATGFILTLFGLFCYYALLLTGGV